MSSPNRNFGDATGNFVRCPPPEPKFWRRPCSYVQPATRNEKQIHAIYMYKVLIFVYTVPEIVNVNREISK